MGGKKKKKEWNEHVTRMDAGRLVKISRENIPAGRRSPGRPKRRRSDLIPNENRRNRLHHRRRSRYTAYGVPEFYNVLPVVLRSSHVTRQMITAEIKAPLLAFLIPLNNLIRGTP